MGWDEMGWAGMGWGVTASNRLHLGTSGKATPMARGGWGEAIEDLTHPLLTRVRLQGGSKEFWQEEPGEWWQRGGGMLRLSSLLSGYS